MTKVTLEFENGATVTYHGTEAEDVVTFLNLNPDDYEPGESVDITTQNPPFLPEEAADGK